MGGIGRFKSLLSGVGAFGSGGGLGGMGGGGSDSGMLSPEFFGPGGKKDKAAAGTGTEGGGDDTPRSRTWSGTGIQRKLSNDST